MIGPIRDVLYITFVFLTFLLLALPSYELFMIWLYIAVPYGIVEAIYRLTGGNK